MTAYFAITSVAMSSLITAGSYAQPGVRPGRARCRFDRNAAANHRPIPSGLRAAAWLPLRDQVAT
jgi:hypothetical protein